MSALSPLKRYRVTIADWVHHIIEIDALSEDDAESKAKEIYLNEAYGSGLVSFERESGHDDTFVDEANDD